MADRDPVRELVQLFGGIRPMMRKLGERAPNLVRSWIVAGAVPRWRRHQIQEAAAQHHIAIPAGLMAAAILGRDLAASPSQPDPPGGG